MGNSHGARVKCSQKTQGGLPRVRGHCRQSSAALRGGLPEERNRSGWGLIKGWAQGSNEGS